MIHVDTRTDTNSINRKRYGIPRKVREMILEGGIVKIERYMDGMCAYVQEAIRCRHGR